MIFTTEIGDIVAGVMALIVPRQSASFYAVARLQQLRIYQMIYIIMILAVGAFLGERMLKRRMWHWS